MNYHTRKWIKPEDLNPNHSLFGGRLLQWIDEDGKPKKHGKTKIEFVSDRLKD